ncbi:RHS repeat-associated core domain-containing protein [Maridesulfovibrio sp.]|uniref:RHS repeat domain-containing protein n=1 Tax=Maridesulfovibrio sp. TaxID=2795000 RepID=UPI0029CA4396|nr:RHS repeat-associated core domain-containing protein [Maridesulfovibrio sp.]
MKSLKNYRMEPRPRSELTAGQVLYGETEPAEMQIENLWKIVDRRTGEELAVPRPDFAEFSTGDRMYPSMMKPEVKCRWDRKNNEWEESKAMHAKLKRMIHAKFMEENPDLPVVQKLKKTTYGFEVNNEYKKHIGGPKTRIKPGTPQTGTGQSIRDEMQRDNVSIEEIGDEVLQFLTPETESPYAVLAVNRDDNLRIEDKILVSEQSSHVLEYQYDEDGRLQSVRYCGEPVEVYRYNRLGQRVFSQIAGGEKQEYRYNDLGQLIRAGATAYSYDADGDLSEKNSPEGITSYEYLETGQLCEVHLPDGTDIEYRFDERGFRTAKYVNGQLIQRYIWKDLTTLAAVEDAGGLSRFHYNEHGRCMGMVRNDQVFLFATDQSGSIFTIADSSGNSVQEVLYDSFGRRIKDSAPEYDTALGFAGGLYDPDTGLIHFGFREYDPTIGRFISPDPLGYAGGDVDLYGYCLDDPINFVDRLGLSETSEASEEDSGSEDKNRSITGMDMRKERQALKEKAEKQSPESKAESSDTEKEEKGALERISDGVGKAVTEGGKAALEAVSKAGEAIADDPRIWGTATGAALLPAAIAGGTLSGEAALSAGAAGARRAAPYLEKGVGKLSKAVKRGKDFVKDVGRKADIDIRTSKIGTKYQLDLEKVGEAATGLIDNQPPSPTLGGAVSAGKYLIEKTAKSKKTHEKK